jgi:hypothetical protein
VSVTTWVGLAGVADVAVAVMGAVPVAAGVAVAEDPGATVAVGSAWACIEAGADCGDHAARARGNPSMKAHSAVISHTGRIPRAFLVSNILESIYSNQAIFRAAR